jgi:hypothetical protein
MAVNQHTRSSVFIKLYKFQQLGTQIVKDGAANLGNGRAYRYATLPSVLDAVKAGLNECGLVLTQIIDGQDLITRLIDPESGEYIESRFPMEFNGLSWHQIGSALTYCRRYSVLSLLGLAPDEDDDAQVTTEKPVTATLGSCEHCHGPMELGPKTNTPFCRPCWQARRNGYAALATNGSHA